ncbi:MAG: D-alanyl-D-alanine carboxypeptidase family protein [Limnochordia bacterium]
MKRLKILLVIALVFCSIGIGQAQTPQLELKAPSGILMEAHNGEVLWAKEPHRRQPVASLTKMMTLTLALEAYMEGRIGLEDMLTASPYASSMGGSQIWWEAGEQLPFRDALYAIGVGSANDAAVVVAEALAGSETQFAARMNQRAQELGLQNTKFVNASGLPASMTSGSGEAHYSTALDMANLARHLIGLPLALEIASTYKYVIRENKRNEVVLWNWNRMIDRTMEESGRRYGYPGMDGLKTGSTTEAGYCLAASAQKDGLRLISVVLGAKNSQERQEDTQRLLDWGFRNFQAVVITHKGDVIGQAPVLRGSREKVDVVAGQDFTIVLPRREKAEIRQELRLHPHLVAPLEEGAVVGQLVVFLGDQEKATIDLITGQRVPKGNLWQLTKGTLKGLLMSLFSKQ